MHIFNSVVVRPDSCSLHVCTWFLLPTHLHLVLAPYRLAFYSCSLHACIWFLLPARLHLNLAPYTLAFDSCSRNACIWFLLPARLHLHLQAAMASWDALPEEQRQARIMQLKLANAMHNRQVVSEWVSCVVCKCVGLARTIYIRCIYGMYGRGITKYTVIYGAYIWPWPTLQMCNWTALATELLQFPGWQYCVAHSSHRQTQFQIKYINVARCQRRQALLACRLTPF